MKLSSLLIIMSVLLHLLIIDLTYLMVTADISDKILYVGGYNLIWLVIAVTIGSKKFHHS